MKVVAAAIRKDGVVYSVPRPGRHDAVIHLMAVGHKLPTPIKGEQGFLTETGQFLDRLQAAELVIQTGQIPELNWPPELYSEDLW